MCMQALHAVYICPHCCERVIVIANDMSTTTQVDGYHTHHCLTSNRKVTISYNIEVVPALVVDVVELDLDVSLASIVYQ